MEDPGDLIAFLAQEERTLQAEALRQELFQKNVEVEQRDDEDASFQIEDKLYTSDPDCMKVGRKVTSMVRINLFPMMNHD